MLTVCLMAFSFVVPAAAAEITNEKYTYSISEQSGEVTEKLTLDDYGDVYEDISITSTLVPKDAVLTFTSKVDMAVGVVGYTEVEGVLVAIDIPWTINGKLDPEFGLPAGTKATVTFSYGLPYYELLILDEETGDSTSFFFKAAAGTDKIEQPDGWAKPEVYGAIVAGLVPTELQNNYKQKITRADFSKLIIKLVEIKAGQTIDELLAENELDITANPFTDTSAKEVIAANKLGIVNGKGNGIFDPNGSITRQEAAIMLTNAAEGLGYDIAADASAFADGSSVASWAKAGVDFVSTYGIMNGTGNNTFSPKGTYTRQQAYMTILRLNDALE